MSLAPRSANLKFRFMAAGSIPTLPPARICCFRASKLVSILVMGQMTALCRKKPSRSSTVLSLRGAAYESEIYPAHHGWTVPDNPTYDVPQAERGFQKLTEFLAATLDRHSG